MNTPALPSAPLSGQRRISTIAAFTAFTISLACRAQPVERKPVPDARPLMIAALKAADGQAHGVMSGELADAITKRFAATSPIFIDVTTEKRYRQFGCARLKVGFWQEGVHLPKAKSPRRQTIEFSINYCLDGLPPKALQ
jgi:hypothetical protein